MSYIDTYRLASIACDAAAPGQHRFSRVAIAVSKAVLGELATLRRAHKAAEEALNKAMTTGSHDEEEKEYRAKSAALFAHLDAICDLPCIEQDNPHRRIIY